MGARVTSLAGKRALRLCAKSLGARPVTPPPPPFPPVLNGHVSSPPVLNGRVSSLPELKATRGSQVAHHAPGKKVAHAHARGRAAQRSAQVCLEPRREPESGLGYNGDCNQARCFGL